MKTRFALAAMCAALALGTGGIAYGETVGSAAAVRPSSTGTPPGGSARQLKAGTNIVSKERIKTTGSGSLQVMFNDKSTMTIGPNSDLVIDEFVYKPGGGGGSFATSLTKGALRFVGGQISHGNGAKINTPVATLVVRGGAAFVTHDAACQALNAKSKTGKTCTKVVCTGGACTVRSRVDARSFQLRINQAVEIGAVGAIEFNVTSVSLNDVAKGGSGGIVMRKGANQAAKFNGKGTIDQTIREQSPEPPPPPPPQ
ncbi:MAG: FecR domain-containing protein [Bauldia sp.]|uniref:FecR family protein n=1 Tax=Bauldia sp. TaxID=2575872 RepID=UPI001DB3B39C|nr:FecR domain-containing protein [Bauldia sp.]MCB1497263.1 FecR domain-containing protein [Bauldia sp.]